MGTRAAEVSAVVVVAVAARGTEEAASVEATGAEEDMVSDTRLLWPQDLRA